MVHCLSRYALSQRVRTWAKGYGIFHIKIEAESGIGRLERKLTAAKAFTGHLKIGPKNGSILEYQKRTSKWGSLKKNDMLWTNGFHFRVRFWYSKMKPFFGPILNVRVVWWKLFVLLQVRSKSLNSNRPSLIYSGWTRACPQKSYWFWALILGTYNHTDPKPQTDWENSEMEPAIQTIWMKNMVIQAFQHCTFAPCKFSQSHRPGK